jgi:hypothetical protein
MTESWDIFVELDSKIYGTIKFGDGSITKIEGQGSIILTCKDSGTAHSLECTSFRG